jgi:hypothetical protein
MVPSEEFLRVAELAVAWYRQRQELKERPHSAAELLPFNRMNEVCSVVVDLVGLTGNQNEYVERLLLLMNETKTLPHQGIVYGSYPLEAAVKWVMEGDRADFDLAIQRFKSGGGAQLSA